MRSLINTYLQHAMRLENFNIFRIFLLILWANTFKTLDFEQKWKTSINTKKFPHYSFIESLINTYYLHSSCHETRENKQKLILSLISWANTFKTQEFRTKIEYFYQH